MTDFFGASDLAGMLGEFGVPVEVWYLGEQFKTTGILDIADEDVTGRTDAGALTGKVSTVIVKTGALPTPSLAASKPITVNEVDYVISTARQIEDGALMRLFLAR